MLGRPITTIELIQINKMFAFGRGYKDLMRDFQKCFNIKLPKPQAKAFMTKRSWSEVMMYLTGEHIEPADDNIPAIERKHFELLEQMLKVNANDNVEREQDLKTFEEGKYFIPQNVKFFNLPLFGEIITYKFKEPFIKCFMFTCNANQKRKLDKIEDIPLSNELPPFLLRILRKINGSYQVVNDLNSHVNEPNYSSMIEEKDIDELLLKNILDCPLFKKYNIVAKTDEN